MNMLDATDVCALRMASPVRSHHGIHTLRTRIESEPACGACGAWRAWRGLCPAHAMSAPRGGLRSAEASHRLRRGPREPQGPQL